MFRNVCKNVKLSQQKEYQICIYIGQALKDDVWENLSQRLFRCFASDMRVLSMLGRVNIV